jgi:hypothetical protein
MVIEPAILSGATICFLSILVPLANNAILRLTWAASSFAHPGEIVG